MQMRSRVRDPPAQFSAPAIPWLRTDSDERPSQLGSYSLRNFNSITSATTGSPCLANHCFPNEHPTTILYRQVSPSSLLNVRRLASRTRRELPTAGQQSLSA